MRSILLAALVLGAPTAPPPGPAEVPAVAAAMVISVTDNVPEATTGDELTYTIGLRNDGGADSGALGVRFEPPSGVDLTTVDHDGTRENGVATWSVEVPARGSLTLTAV